MQSHQHAPSAGLASTHPYESGAKRRVKIAVKTRRATWTIRQRRENVQFPANSALAEAHTSNGHFFPLPANFPRAVREPLPLQDTFSEREFFILQAAESSP
jgi:hypothetical protein